MQSQVNEMIVNPKPLKITAWNANGLYEKKLDLEEFLNRSDSDIALISETHLHGNLIPKIRNYILYNTNRQTGRGSGTVIYIKTHIKHHLILNPLLVNIEATLILVSTEKSGNIIIGSIYKPPVPLLLKQDLDALMNTGSKVLLAGDFNCKHSYWNSRQTNPNGRRLFEYINNSPISVLGPPNPTHFDAFGSDVLDICLIKNIPLQIEVNNCDELNSDHNPIIINVGSDYLKNQFVKTTEIINWDLKIPENWENMKIKKDKIPIFDSIEQTDLAIENLINTINEEIERSTSTRQIKSPTYEIPNDIKFIIK